MQYIQEKLSSIISYIGAAISVVTGLSLNQWGVIVGIGTAVLTYIGNKLYQKRKERLDREYQDRKELREHELHELTQKKIRLEIEQLSK